MLVVIGPTASGKTRYAVQLAAQLGGEILSADSRQVYQGMDIGTGKDLEAYQYGGRKIPYHLIDIVAAGERYNVYRYMHDFFEAYKGIISRGAVPIVCGGSGMYIEAVCCGFDMPNVPEERALREKYKDTPHEELIERLATYGNLHNTTDTQSRKRLIRAIEIAEWKRIHPLSSTAYPKVTPHIIGLRLPVEERRARIDCRLEERLQQGMVEEAQRLMSEGLTVEDMLYYGLEYKFLALYLTGKLTFDEMKQQLRTAIHQFAKRQMTWFRGMERRGLHIHWIDALREHEDIVNEIRHFP
jgi:tRNA dimethylallyltransferase